MTGSFLLHSAKIQNIWHNYKKIYWPVNKMAERGYLPQTSIKGHCPCTSSAVILS
jgi:hypothetical protein